MTVEPGDLKIARVFSNVGIIERTLGMGFFKRAIIEHVVENHGNAQRPYLYRVGHPVLQRETQNKLSFFKRPRTRDLQGNVGRKRG